MSENKKIKIVVVSVVLIQYTLVI